MMSLAKLQLRAKLEVASFIYYGNIREFVFKIWISQNGEPLIFLEKLTQCFLLNVQFLWSCDCRKWLIFTKTTSFNGKFHILGGWEWG